MSEREQRVELIQQRLIKELRESNGEGIRISEEAAMQIVFMLDIIRVMIRKIDEVIK